MHVLLVNSFLLYIEDQRNFCSVFGAVRFAFFTPYNIFNNQWLFNSIEQYYSYFSDGLYRNRSYVYLFHRSQNALNEQGYIYCSYKSHNRTNLLMIYDMFLKV